MVVVEDNSVVVVAAVGKEQQGHKDRERFEQLGRERVGQLGSIVGRAVELEDSLGENFLELNYLKLIQIDSRRFSLII